MATDLVSGPTRSCMREISSRIELSPLQACWDGSVVFEVTTDPVELFRPLPLGRLLALSSSSGGKAFDLVTGVA